MVLCENERLSRTFYALHCRRGDAANDRPLPLRDLRRNSSMSSRLHLATALAAVVGLATAFAAPAEAQSGVAVGNLMKFGVDIGYTQGGVLIWTVIAPAAILAPGSLAGSYAGGTASATVGVGVGAHELVGGSNNTIALQPLSLEGNSGLNVAAGIGAITLAPAAR